jgi:hypothetical protein
MTAEFLTMRDDPKANGGKKVPTCAAKYRRAVFLDRRLRARLEVNG